MPLNTKDRRILVTQLRIRNEKIVPISIPVYELSTVKNIITKKHQEDDTEYLFQNQTKRIRIKNVKEYAHNNEKYFCILLSLSDKNAPDAAYESFETNQTRKINKQVNEGNSFTTHMFIKEISDNNSYLTLIEEVPGFNTKIIERYLTFILRDEKYINQYIDEKGKTRKNRAIFEIYGYQSNRIRDALNSGKLEDIEFVSHHKIDDGFDEYGYIKEEVQHVNFVVKRGIETDSAEPFFKNMVNKFKKGNHEKMFIRIKTDTGQTKVTEVNTNIDLENDSILDQFFIHCEYVRGFENPLEQSHDSIREDLIEKMKSIANKYKTIGQ